MGREGASNRGEWGHREEGEDDRSTLGRRDRPGLNSNGANYAAEGRTKSTTVSQSGLGQFKRGKNKEANRLGGEASGEGVTALYQMNSKWLL